MSAPTDWSPGNVAPDNIQAGTADISTDGNGDGTVAVTFHKSFKSDDPSKISVVANAREADDTGIIDVTSITLGGCTIGVDASAVVSGTLTVSWQAILDPRA